MTKKTRFEQGRDRAEKAVEILGAVDGRNDLHAVQNHLRETIRGFVNDPPDNDFQLGYLDGLLVFAREGLGIDIDFGA